MVKIFKAYESSFRDMFLLAMPFTVAAFIVALFLRETPLKDSTLEVAEDETFEPHQEKQAAL